MAQKMVPYDDVALAIQTDKYWPPGLRFDWKCASTKRFPAPYSFRTSLALDPSGAQYAEDWFVELYFKRARIVGARDTISITLVVNKTRTVAVDDNGPGSHVNKVGDGLPYYQQAIGFPHLHLPVPQASYGYAEPLSGTTVQGLWELFLTKANITGAPRIELPEFGQMDLGV